MTSISDIDPYVVLGVQKDATLADIKSAHRKLVLKWHPDKVKDESQRSQAQDEFQKVQQAYELLSDETRRAKYDNKVRLAELRREMMARGGNPNGSPSRSNGSGSTVPREYRNGRIYEERTPADATNYYEEDGLYSDGTRPTARKYDDYGKRRAKVAEEKKKKEAKSVPLSAARAAKEMLRDNVKTTHSSRDKYRTKERKRDAYDKRYPERAAPYSESEDDGAASDSSASSYYVRVKRPSEKRSRESSTRKARPTESTRRPEPARYESEDYSDRMESKHEKMHTTARDYILRSKGTVPIEIDRRARASRSPPRPHAYDSADPESSSSRRSNRSNRPSKETVRSSSSRNNSYEHIESQSRPYDAKVPSMPTAATSPAVKVSSSIRPSLQSSRSASTAQSHSRPKTLGRTEQFLLHMVHDGNSRTTKLRNTDKYDSGYSSPGTPDLPPGESPMKTRYKIVPDTVLVEPSMPSPHASSRHARGHSPPRQDRSGSSRPMPKPVRSSTYAYPAEYSGRYESSSRPSASRQSSSRPLYGEVEYTRSKDRDYKYAREIGPEHIPHSGRDAYSRRMDDYPHPPIGRRQSAYAQ
ncbi:DnaJ-domain-containing protein [Aspergillus japonicus CBS 114.51]|uniref:DnaJ-domain-containing protein n=2 Tax=Aspergillus TaxID=5052 RepID=A0A2V5I139_ASPV1|nr:DnaJ-domain-containing protein [Aspergillus japonicus CBS 114.51]PYI17817.1 DnaJ-domain-containing protein [Aspergillus violaceofuscus CBS 115571]RAH83481.1 DnaJ-domain-containing protein [Aspergillus japonicus CBS 114.51]